MVLATRCDSLRNFDRELERSRRLKSRNLRLASRARAFDEGEKLLLQGFFALNRNSVARDFSRFAPINFSALFFVIERQIRVLLENPDLAHPLRTDPARGHVRHATIFKTNSRIPDFFPPAQNRNPD